MSYAVYWKTIWIYILCLLLLFCLVSWGLSALLAWIGANWIGRK